MELAAKILIVGGVLNIVAGYVAGFILSSVRGRSPAAPKYLKYAHMFPLIHGPILLSLVLAMDLSPLSQGIEALAAGLLVASSALSVAKDIAHWVRGTRDEFAETSPLFYVGAVGVAMGTIGLAITVVGVFMGLL